MNMDETDFILTEAELASAQRELRLVSTELGVKPGAQATPVVVLDTVDPHERDRFTWMMQTLASPAKRVIFHYALGDDSFARSVVAWGEPGNGDVATMAQTGTLLRFGTRTGEDLALLAGNALAGDAGLRETVLSLGMSSAGLLTWLAAVEHLQALKLSAMLGHHAPEHLFNRAEIEARLAGATDEDFRWPLMFLDKVLPGELPSSLIGTDLDRGFFELEELGLVEDAGGGIWETTPQGDWLTCEMLSSVSKVGCGIAAYGPDGTIGYRTMMFVRTPRHVLLHMIDGNESVVAALSADGLSRFLNDVFADPDSHEPSTAPSVRYCSSCGTAVRADDRFCSQCGAASPGGAL